MGLVSVGGGVRLPIVARRAAAGGGDDGPGYSYPSFTSNANVTVAEGADATFTFTAVASDAVAAAAAITGDFLMRLDCPTGTADSSAAVGLHTDNAFRDYGTGYYELQFGGADQAKTIHYNNETYYADIPDGNGPIFVRRVGSTLDVRYGGTSWVDATPLVDAVLAAYSQTLDWLWVYLYGDRDELTMTFLPLP